MVVNNGQATIYSSLTIVYDLCVGCCTEAEISRSVGQVGGHWCSTPLLHTHTHTHTTVTLWRVINSRTAVESQSSRITHPHRWRGRKSRSSRYSSPVIWQ